MSDSAHLDDSSLLLAHLAADGSSIGNQRLRDLLGWDETRYLAARQPLIDPGLLATGRGRGGAVKRLNANGSDPSSRKRAVQEPCGEEITHRSPAAIMKEIAELDAESAKVLKSIKALL